MRRARRAIQRLQHSLLAAIFGMLLAAPAFAADPNAEARANAIYKDAKERFEAGDLQKALSLVKQAEGLFSHPAIIFLRGRVLHKMARLREADEALRLADTAALPKPLQKPLVDERTAVVEEMRTKGELLLTVDPDTARVTIDGDDVRLDSVGWLAPGKHRVEATAPGFQPMLRDVQIAAGDSASATLRLVPVAGSLVIIVPGGLRDAEVRLDGLLVELKAGEKLGDRTPPMHVQAGPHRVVCNRGTDESAHDVEVSANGATEVTCSDVAPSTGTGRKVLGWTGVAAGAGLLGAGAYGLLSYFLVDAKDPRFNDSRYQVSNNKVIYGSTYAAVGIAVGICSWLFLLRDPQPADSKN